MFEEVNISIPQEDIRALFMEFDSSKRGYMKVTDMVAFIDRLKETFLPTKNKINKFK